MVVQLSSFLAYQGDPHTLSLFNAPSALHLGAADFTWVIFITSLRNEIGTVFDDVVLCVRLDSGDISL